MSLNIIMFFLHLLDIGLPVILAGMYFHQIFEYRKSPYLFQIWNFLGMLFIITLPNFYGWLTRGFENHLTVVILNLARPIRLIIFIEVFMIGSHIFLLGTFWKKFYHVLQFSFSYLICEYGYALTVERLSSRYAASTTSMALMGLLEYIVFSVIVIGFFQLQLHFFLKKSMEMTTKHYISMIPLLIIFLILIIVSMQLNVYVFNMILFLSLILINISINYLYRGMMITSKKIAEEQLISRERDYFQQRMLDEKELSKIRHDMKNLLLSVQADIELKDFKSASSKLDQITNVISATNHCVTGFHTLDVILSPKIDTMHTNKIDFRTEFQLIQEAPLKKHALYLSIILGNLMDNAIEACMRMEQDRFVDLKIKQDDSMLTIFLANSAHRICISAEGSQPSEKEDGRTGFGVGSIREHVSALHGYCSFMSFEDRFQVIVQLPLANETPKATPT